MKRTRRPHQRPVTAAATARLPLAAPNIESATVLISSQIVRAILLAKAMATSILGFFASMRARHYPGHPSPHPFQKTTDIAPMSRKRWISRWLIRSFVELSSVHFNVELGLTGLSQIEIQPTARYFVLGHRIKALLFQSVKQDPFPIA